MSISNRREVLLRVAEAKPRDVNKGKIRIGSYDMRVLGIKPGSYVEIEGRRKTVAIAVKADPEDEGAGIVRMDRVTRQNARVQLGDMVKIRPINPKSALSIRVALKVPIDYEFSGAQLRAFLQKKLRNRAFVEGDEFVVETDLPGTSRFIVVSTKPEGPVKITRETQLIVITRPIFLEEGARVTYSDVGGLSEVIRKVREMVELPLKYPKLFKRLGIEPPKGVLFHGPPGTGKTLLARAVANEADAFFISVNGPEIMSKFYGESEAKLREIFEEAKRNAPSIIFIDEIDAIAPKRSEVTGEVEKRVVAQLLALMDGLEPRSNVVVIGATNRVNSLDPALRRPGRFDREIEFPVPNRQARLEILKIHTRHMPLADDVDLEKLADMTHGFVGADIAALCKEAAMRALRRYLPEIDLDKGIDDEVLEKVVVTQSDFLEALKEITPSALREVYVEATGVKWEDVGGLKEAKRELMETLIWPIKYPQVYERMGIEPARGILLVGPPGTGKTLLAKAVATESGLNFISISGPEIFSKWVGESERAIREVFRKARMAAPCIVFLDEVESIATRRGVVEGESGVSERVLSQLLTELDGFRRAEGVFVLAATNRPDLLDPAIIRPGRLDKIILVGPPNLEERLEILRIYTRRMPLAEDVNLREIAERTEYYTGSDLKALVREAALIALREDINARSVEMRHFLAALNKVGPSLNDSIIKFYENWVRNASQLYVSKPSPISFL